MVIFTWIKKSKKEVGVKRMSITGKRKILSSPARGATYYHPRAVLQAFMVSWLTFERKCRCINCLYISIHPPGWWPFSYTSCSWVTLSHPSMYDLPPANSHYRPFCTPSSDQARFLVRTFCTLACCLNSASRKLPKSL